MKKTSGVVVFRDNGVSIEIVFRDKQYLEEFLEACYLVIKTERPEEIEIHPEKEILQVNGKTLKIFSCHGHAITAIACYKKVSDELSVCERV